MELSYFAKKFLMVSTMLQKRLSRVFWNLNRYFLILRKIGFIIELLEGEKLIQSASMVFLSSIIENFRLQWVFWKKLTSNMLSEPRTSEFKLKKPRISFSLFSNGLIEFSKALQKLLT